MSRLFYTHGKWCATHPMEVMFPIVALTVCMLFSMDRNGMVSITSNSSANECVQLDSQCYQKSQSESAEAVIMILSFCMSIMYGYYQFRTVYMLGSKYLFGISCLFTVFSIFIFCNSLFVFLNGYSAELKKALPFFLLLSDLSKASLLAQFALTSRTKEEVRENIARGMAILGPSLTLDTVVETLAIGVGTLSGVTRLEEISYFACLAVVVNYVVFMTFFPACLSLALELSHNSEGERTPVWQLSSLTKVLQLESEHTTNPVIQRVKLIMSAGLVLVHTLSRWPTVADSDTHFGNDFSMNSHSSHYLNNRREPNILELFFAKILAIGSEQIVMIGLVCALAIKYIFFENKDNYSEHIMTITPQQSQQSLQRSDRSDQQMYGQSAEPEEQPTPSTSRQQSQQELTRLRSQYHSANKTATVLKRRAKRQQF